MKVNLRKITASILVFCLVSLATGFSAQANYSSNYKSETIEIREVDSKSLAQTGKVSLTGRSTLDQVWFCVRGPANELITYPAEMKGGEFNLDIWLRFGAGTYTIWAGDNPNRFDGKIRIVLESSFNQDLRYLAPSAYVDSTNPRLIKLTNSLLKPSMTELEKTKAIYDWVTRNISYDYNAYLKNENILTTASSVLQTKEGLCRDYAFLTAALARAAGLQAKVVYGSTGKSGNWEAGLHAWNEIYADGRWVILDTTWGAGYITNNGKFVSSPSDKYFNPDLASFAKTHLATNVTYH